MTRKAEPAWFKVAGRSADKESVGSLGRAGVDAMRWFGAVGLAAGAIWMSGCGSAIAPLPGNAGTGLTLADSVSQAHYRLSVINGATVLTQVDGTSAAAADVGLVDGATGARYAVVVTRGALTLVPGGSSGASQIELNDTETARAYALAVQSGALTLAQK